MTSARNDSDSKSQIIGRVDINNAEGLSIGNQFFIQKRLKAGVFGVVYKIQDQKSNQNYALKFEKCEIKHDTLNQRYHQSRTNLRKEIQILQELHGIEGVPKIISFGRKFNHSFLIQTLYDTDLNDKMAKYKLKSLSINSALELARQMILILQRIHEKGFVHRDLKPDNIMIGKDIKIRNSYNQNCQPNNNSNTNFTTQNLTSVQYLNSVSEVPSQFKARELSPIDVPQRVQARNQTLTEQLRNKPKRDSQLVEDLQIGNRFSQQRLENTQIIRKDQTKNGTLYKYEYAEPTSLQLVVSQANINNQFAQQTPNTSYIDKNVYLIDFGIAKKIISSNRQHISFQENKQFVGTLRYASIAAHLGQEIGRKDDLESLGYIIIYLMKGKLPWQGIEKGQKVTKQYLKEQLKRIKCQTPIAELCSGLPQGVFEYMKYVRSLKFHEQPSYETCWKLLKMGCFANGSSSEQFIFNGWDWDNIKNVENHSEFGSIKLGTIITNLTVNNLGSQLLNPNATTIQIQEEIIEPLMEQKSQINQNNAKKSAEWRKSSQTRRSKSLSVQTNEIYGLDVEDVEYEDSIKQSQQNHYDKLKIEDDGSQFTLNKSSFINLSLLKSSSFDFNYSPTAHDSINQRKTPQKSQLGNQSPKFFATSSRFSILNQGSSHFHQRSQNSFYNNPINQKDSQNNDYDSKDEEYYNDYELIVKIKNVNQYPQPRFLQVIDIK